jgi:hypothetical protein
VLPTDHVFVVQFQVRSRRHRLAAAGRVEHLRSGEAIHFGSPEELLAFTRRVLGGRRRAPHAMPPKVRQATGNHAATHRSQDHGPLLARGEAAQPEPGRPALDSEREGES